MILEESLIFNFEKYDLKNSVLLMLLTFSKKSLDTVYSMQNKIGLSFMSTHKSFKHLKKSATNTKKSSIISLDYTLRLILK